MFATNGFDTLFAITGTDGGDIGAFQPHQQQAGNVIVIIHDHY
ncbi:hypothetical protein MTE01_30370 [Microbacterium testaceum]|uniref:Uncharacterized protein n=1 Tax=Microbacterium testaceum TaxID=2033 RepID=A0A4Y3QPL5_MICTE|nr:hypothetical protein MTE01_30370 [Microbacterium testaceum]